MFDSGYLVHHLLIDSQTTGGIDDDHVIPHPTRLCDSSLRFLHGVRFIQTQIDVCFDLLAQHAQLLNGRRTIHIASYEHDALVLLRLQIVRQLGGKSGLTATLKTGHQNNRRLSFEVNLLRLAAHQFCQLVMRDFNHQLTGTDSVYHVLSQCFLLHAVGELFGGLVVHIRLKQRFADILDGFRYVDFGNTAFTLQNLE